MFGINILKLEKVRNRITREPKEKGKKDFLEDNELTFPEHIVDENIISTSDTRSGGQDYEQSYTVNKLFFLRARVVNVIRSS